MAWILNYPRFPSLDRPTPNQPSPMTEGEVDFIGKMILDELLELFATKYDSATAKAKMTAMIAGAKALPQEDYAGRKHAATDEAADQTDALVDIYYYSLNAACKKGMNMSAVFDIVHQANMAKRDPKTGEFLKRADGKIIKPEGWTAPDVEAELKRQHDEGSFEPLAADKEN